MELASIVILLAYASIVVEILGFPVPSIASSYQLIWVQEKAEGAGLLARIQHWPVVLKFVLLMLPSAAIVFIYCLPLLWIFWEVKFESLFGAAINSGLLGLVAGVILIVAGRTMAFAAVFAIRKKNKQVGDSFDLKTKGLFAKSRNPILIGMYLTFMGFLCFLPNIWLLFGFVLYLSHMHFRVLIEEDFLLQKFGAQFAKYMAQTRRYL